MWYAIEDSEDEGKTDQSVQDIDFTLSRAHQGLNKKRTVHRETFAQKLQDKKRGLALFGTVPPPRKLPMDRVRSIGEAVGAEVKAINPDGIVIYDIQDEPSRSGEERPFPFFETHYPRDYAKLIKEHINPSTEPIVFRAMIPGQTEEEFATWAQETTANEEFDLHNFVLVGGDTRSGKPVLTVDQAGAIMKMQDRGVLMGGITIPERHRDRNDEPERMHIKIKQGISFFTSQVVYNIDNAIWFLQDYQDYCIENEVEPTRIVFTFAPFGSERTVKFMEWLGIEIPIGTQKRVLSREGLKARIQESMRICWENWKRILDWVKRAEVEIPIGFSVEAVSKSKMEQKGAVTLYTAMKELMKAYYRDDYDTLFSKMLKDDATYIVETKDGGARVTKLTEQGPIAFSTVQTLPESTKTSLRRTMSRPSNIGNTAPGKVGRAVSGAHG